MYECIGSIQLSDKTSS